MSKPTKKTKGRQKIEMTKILNDKALAVTFSKRHAGIFSKFNELSTLCGVKFATIIFSPTKKPCSYGIPSVEEVINRYLEQLPPSHPSISRYMQPYQNASIQELNNHFTEMIALVQAAKKTGEELEIVKKAMQDSNWRNAPIETLQVDQLEEVKATMLGLKNNAKKQVERLKMVEAATTFAPTVFDFKSTGPSNGAGPSK